LSILQQIRENSKTAQSTNSHNDHGSNHANDAIKTTTKTSPSTGRMSTSPGSNIYSRARRSPAVAAPAHTHPISSRIKTSHYYSSPHQKKRYLFRAFALCAIVSLVVELLLLRASLKYYNAEETIDDDSSSIELEQQPVPPRRPASGPPDGTFNGYPVYYRNVSAVSYTKPTTLLNCVGENFQPDSWKHRSCHFQFFCFNVTNRKFQIYEREEDRMVLPWSQQVPLMDLSESLLSNSTVGVSLGGINLKWLKGIQRLQWFPQVLQEPPTEFYALPEKVVMIPFHSLGGHNPGHAVWDDFLPMFTLMQIFLLSTDSHEILALRYHLEHGEGLWASCEASEKVEACQRLQEKFWPLLNNHSHPRTQQNVQFQVDGFQKTDLICAKQGLAGMGDLTDHGTQKVHGWQPEDYQITHNHGRGGLFWKFRTFCLNNLGVSTSSNALRQAPFRIVISVQSSSSKARSFDFTEQHKYLTQALGDEGVDVDVSTVILKDLSLKEQVQLASETSIFISGCGGGAVTATFLPRGAAAIIYYSEAGGQKHNAATGLPARLDWDLFNHLSYLHVHWFPRLTMNTQEDLNTLLQLVRDTLHRQKQEIS
jgi:hypothetical protein